jgi:hypothetical protein
MAFQIRFASGGRGGVPSTYQYGNISAEMWEA